MSTNDETVNLTSSLQPEDLGKTAEMFNTIFGTNFNERDVSLAIVLQRMAPHAKDRSAAAALAQEAVSFAVLAGADVDAGAFTQADRLAHRSLTSESERPSLEAPEDEHEENVTEEVDDLAERIRNEGVVSDEGFDDDVAPPRRTRRVRDIDDE